MTELEPNAWSALRETGPLCVLAGPGAGKTEFLAQRATFLLETGLCPPPRKVLAISYKADAAENLAARVGLRCGAHLASRFTSRTFDALTKGLVDRFLPALPPAWRPPDDYGLAFPDRKQVEGFLTRARLGAPAPWSRAVGALGSPDFLPRVLGEFRLPVEWLEPANGEEFAIERWWRETMRDSRNPSLSFLMLNRLAELLLRTQPRLARALRATYSHVFVDEFQDTTYAQYDFLLSAFRGTRTVVTVVGDDNQRIMAWAGARPDPFGAFGRDFAAKAIPLLSNFRSSPGLVRIQHVVARAMDPGAPEPVARNGAAIDGDVAQVWTFQREADEARRVAAWVRADIEARGTRPEEYAILVRQTADRFEAQLAAAMADRGLAVRNESKAVGRTTLQDLGTDRLCAICVALARLATGRRAHGPWRVASEAIQRLRNVDPRDEVAGMLADDDLTSFVRDLRRQMASRRPDAVAACELAGSLVEFVDPAALARTHAGYGTGEALEIAMDAFVIHLAACAEGALTWAMCLDRFEGVGHVPLMTVHKSKGLEYDTILFMGLDDGMWWSHSATNPEGKATFFVALSRARQRAIFTFCLQRGARTRVADLHGLLAEAGVPEVAF